MPGTRRARCASTRTDWLARQATQSRHPCEYPSQQLVPTHIHDEREVGPKAHRSSDVRTVSVVCPIVTRNRGSGAGVQHFIIAVGSGLKFLPLARNRHAINRCHVHLREGKDARHQPFNLAT